MSEKGLRFPVIRKTEVVTEPTGAVYYEVAANGLFQIRDTAAYHAVTAARLPIPGLLSEEQQLTLRFPPLPAKQTEKVLAFFQAAYQRYRSEAIAIIFYRPDRRAFRLEVPPQAVRGWDNNSAGWIPCHGVSYGSVDRPAGHFRLGTIHSHADLAAFSSDIDHRDEQFEDGLHIVFGGFGTRRPSVSASFVANGVRFTLDPKAVMEPYCAPSQSPPAEWMAQIKCGGVATGAPAKARAVVARGSGNGWSRDPWSERDEA